MEAAPGSFDTMEGRNQTRHLLEHDGRQMQASFGQMFTIISRGRDPCIPRYSCSNSGGQVLSRFQRYLLPELEVMCLLGKLLLQAELSSMAAQMKWYRRTFLLPGSSILPPRCPKHRHLKWSYLQVRRFQPPEIYLPRESRRLRQHLRWQTAPNRSCSSRRQDPSVSSSRPA